jgi:predicted glutamine amidotransferase
MYLGRPVLVDDLLFQPESSLVKQAFMPRMLHMLNLAGFGMLAWDPSSHAPDVPYSYSSPALPIFDRNLKAMSRKILGECVIAHVRGVAYSTEVEISNQNTHPFHYGGYRLALAHNGDLYRFAEMKADILQLLRPEIAAQIAGSTDSEWIYALYLSQFEDANTSLDGEMMMSAAQSTLRHLREIRKRHGIDTSSSVNLFITDGTQALGVRFCFDFGCYRTSSPDAVHEANLRYLSMWYTTGREFGFHEDEWKMIGGEETADSLIIASEPLTHDTATWLETPEYSMIYAKLQGQSPRIECREIDA